MVKVKSLLYEHGPVYLRRKFDTNVIDTPNKGKVGSLPLPKESVDLILKLCQEGKNKIEISRITKLSYKTVRKYISYSEARCPSEPGIAE